MKLKCETVRHHTEESACDHCGGPVYGGERVYYLDDGRCWCSRRCAAYADSDAEHDRGNFRTIFQETES